MKLANYILPCLLSWTSHLTIAAPTDTKLFKRERAIASKFQIEAKECKIERESDSGVCMFNYECYKRKGTVLGTCIDGFLFGACCRLPKEGEDEEIVDITEEDDEVSTKKPDSSDETVSILSDLLSKSDLESIDEIINEIENDEDEEEVINEIENDDEDEEEVITASTEASQEMIENSLFLDSIEVPLEIDNNIPSIILGNGSVVSLESLSLKPELYKPTTEGSSTSQQQENNNQLFTWFTIDQLFNSTTTTESTTSSESTSTTLMTGSTQDLPFLDDLFSFDDEFLSSTTKSKTSTTTSTTSTTTSTTTTTTTSTTTTTTTSSTSTTTTTTTTAKTSTVKSTTDSIWPDPFLDLGNKEKVTLRPDLDAENVNEHLDIFVNSILASINESIPALLDQLTTESTENEVDLDPEEDIKLTPVISTSSSTSTSTTSTTTLVTKKSTAKPKTAATTTSTTTTSTTSTTTATTTTTGPTTTREPWDYRKDCGVRPLRGQGRIVGGEKSKFGDWPWQVLVKESTWLGLFTKNKCGGVLISDRHVLTAAHCQPGFLASLLVELGEYDISGPNEFMSTREQKVKRVVIHKDYKAPTFENDIAILELESPIERQPHVVPICMPTDDKEEFLGRMGIVTGWGRLEYGGSVPNILHQVSVPVIDNGNCQDMFNTSGHKKTIRDSFLCAGYKEGKKDSCEGDSGGPLMWQQEDGRWLLMGTVSHGIKCAYPNLPGVYMRMTYYRPWIEKVTGVKF